MENQFQENSDKKSVNKTLDLFIGILGGIGYVILSIIVFTSVKYFIPFLWGIIALYVIAIFLFFYIKRHYISIGLISIIAVPLSIIGSCMLLWKSIYI